MSYKVYVDEKPTEKKAMKTLRTKGRDTLKNIKEYSKTHSKMVTQAKIQHLLAWLDKLSKKSPEIAWSFNSYMIRRDKVKSNLRKFIKYPLTPTLEYQDFHDYNKDLKRAKTIFKIMNTHPEWKYYIGTDGGINDFTDISLPKPNTPMVYVNNVNEKIDFYTHIWLYGLSDIQLLIDMASDSYDDKYLDYSASQEKWDKAHHCQIIYRETKFPHPNSWRYKKLRRDKGSYLIKTGISNLHTFHHWEDVKRILDGFALIGKINPEKSFDVNFNPNHLDRNQVCLHRSSKYWLEMLKYWPKRLNTNKDSISNRAKRYINKDIKNVKIHNENNIKHASNRLYYAIQNSEKLLNKSLKNHYFTKFARKHIKVHQDKNNPNVIVANFIGHQPFCIDRSDDIMDNYLKYSAKYDTKNKTVTFSDNNSIADLIKGLFGNLGLGPSMPSYKQTNKKYNHIKGIHQLNSTFINYYKNILDVFNKHGFRDYY